MHRFSIIYHLVLIYWLDVNVHTKMGINLIYDRAAVSFTKSVIDF